MFGMGLIGNSCGFLDDKSQWSDQHRTSLGFYDESEDMLRFRDRVLMLDKAE